MTLAPKIAISDDFLKSFADVPRDQQHAVLTFLAKFRQNPMASGINYERIHDAADSNMRSVRINGSVRGIVLKPSVGNVYCLLWVDRHDDAYEWARRHKVAIHPDVGSIQVYAVDAAVAASAQQVAPPKDPDAQPSLFVSLSDAEIRRLGVPDDRLDLVRGIASEDELDILQKQLPDEAFEALYFLAAGEPYEKIIAELTPPASVDPADYDAALDRDESKRHFLVLTDDSDLEALLAAPLERWRIFLHPSQRKLIERDWSGPVKVTGGAGTGKTVVAMHRAARLARQYAALPGRPVVFTTFTRTLAEDIRRHLGLLCTPQELEKIQVTNLDEWANSLLRRFGYKSSILYDEGARRDYWRAAMAAMPAMNLSAHFMRAEYERVVLPQFCETPNDYMRASRAGRGGQLPRATRKAIWPVFAEYRAQLHAHNRSEPEEAFRDARQLLIDQGAELGIRSMVIDEAQDVSAAAFQLIRAAVPTDSNDLFIVGDAHQRIYRHKVVLSRAGIEVRGRSRSLRVNYRTTDEIRRWACAQLEGCEIDDLDGNSDSLRGYRSLTHGERPDMLISTSQKDDLAHIKTVLGQLSDDGIEARQICVAARTNADLATIADGLKQLGIAHLRLDQEQADDPTAPGVRVATMHRIKGLEFSVVIISGYRGSHAYAAQFARDEDAGVSVDTETAERCLLHVAATRAKRHLVILQRPTPIERSQGPAELSVYPVPPTTPGRNLS